MSKTITLDGKEYIELSGVKCSRTYDGLEYKIVRCYSAGVFAAYVENEDGSTLTLRNARRLWYWSGAASLSQLANDGVADPKNCKFPAPVSKIKVLNVIEILDVTAKAQKSIESVPEWKK